MEGKFRKLSARLENFDLRNKALEEECLVASESQNGVVELAAGKPKRPLIQPQTFCWKQGEDWPLCLNHFREVVAISGTVSIVVIFTGKSAWKGPKGLGLFVRAQAAQAKFV